MPPKIAIAMESTSEVAPRTVGFAVEGNACGGMVTWALGAGFDEGIAAGATAAWPRWNG